MLATDPFFKIIFNLNILNYPNQSLSDPDPTHSIKYSEQTHNITLPSESSTNLRRIATSPDGLFLLAIDENNRCQFINLPRRAVLHRITFKHPIADAKFRPNGKFIALAAGQKDVIVGVFLGTDKKINKVCKMHTVSRDGTIFTWGCNEMDGNNGEPESLGTPEQGQGNNEEGDSDKIVKKRKNFDGKYGVRS
ncbi:hypothetical protein P3S68_031197 [Capsicum galapagoense]